MAAWSWWFWDRRKDVGSAPDIAGGITGTPGVGTIPGGRIPPIESIGLREAANMKKKSILHTVFAVNSMLAFSQK